MVTILKDSHLLLCNGKINKGQRYYRNKTIKSTDIITGDTRSTIEIEDDVEFLYAYLTYTIIKYNTSYTSKVKVGEINHE